jgi:hypothetical protein
MNALLSATTKRKAHLKPQRPAERAIPWLTEEGYFDVAQFPIDSVLKQAISRDAREFQSALRVLDSMCNLGRKEAGIFLIGLLVTCEDDWEKRSEIVRELRNVETEACARVLFGELKRVKSTNTTRQYLKAVIDRLARMPSNLVLEGFQDLAEDKSFTHRMRNIFRAVVDDLSY